MAAFERSFLAKPAVKALLATWPDRDENEVELEAIRQRQRNDDIYVEAIRAFWRRTDPIVSHPEGK